MMEVFVYLYKFLLFIKSFKNCQLSSNITAQYSYTRRSIVN